MRSGTVAMLLLAMLGGVGTPTFAEVSRVGDVAAAATPMPRAQLADESIYFVMTDRYANADPSNDRGNPSYAAGLAAGGFNPASSGAFHGGDLRGLTANLDRIRNLGFTAIWITPPFVNRAVQGNSSGYHGYWIVDFTRIDPHLGDEQDFRNFVDAAHRIGLKVYVDVVINHTADINAYSDGFGFGDPDTKRPSMPDEFTGARTPSWLNALSSFHNQGNISSWTSRNQLLNGDFFGLDDLNTESELVRRGLIAVYADFLEKFSVDGYRLDTARHVDDAFLKQWSTAMIERAREIGKPDFAIFGEVAIPEPVSTASYVRLGLPSVLDFSLQSDLVRFARRTGTGQQIFATVGIDDYYNVPRLTGPPVNAYSLTVFGGNHDMGRIAYQLGADKRSLPMVKLATSMLFLLRGVPVVYYGDEVGMIGSGGDKAARQDMFPTKVTAWQKEPRVGADPIGTRSSLHSTSHPLVTHITSLNAIRRKYSALRSGALWPRKANDTLAIWSRFDRLERREFLVAANAGSKPATTVVQTSSPRTAFVAVFGSKNQAVTSDAQGRLRVTVSAQSLIVLRAMRELPPTVNAVAPTISARLERDVGGTLLTAQIPTTLDPVSVSFAVRDCTSCNWVALGTDDAAPYRFVFPEERWVDLASVEVVAVSLTSDGRSAASKPRVLQRSDFTP